MSASGRSVIWWAGAGDGAGLDGLDREVVGTVGMAQAGAAGVDPGGFGLLLEGEAWKAQLEPGHALRTVGFEALEWVRAGARHEPEAWSAGEREDFVVAYVDAQVRRGATLLVTPGHDALPDVDAELAAAAAEHVRAKALRAEGCELYASLRLRPGGAVPIDAYTSTDVDGYVVWLAGFGGTAPEVERLLALIKVLSATGRGVVVAGAGPFWQLALLHGATAAVHGIEDAAIYHGAVLDHVEDEVTLRRLFMLRNCDCGAHDPSTAPRGAEQIRAHNRWWAMKEAGWSCLPDTARATFTLALRAAAAKTNRDRLGLAPLGAGWESLVGADEGHAAEDDGSA